VPPVLPLMACSLKLRIIIVISRSMVKVLGEFAFPTTVYMLSETSPPSTRSQVHR
jgi:hypothetical protein